MEQALLPNCKVRRVIMVCHLAMRLYVCILYICIYPSQSIIDASVDCAIGTTVLVISQSFLWVVKTGSHCKLAALTMTKPR